MAWCVCIWSGMCMHMDGLCVHAYGGCVYAYRIRSCVSVCM